MTLEELTPEQMAEAARSLAYCLEQRAWEDAAGWLVQIQWSLCRHQSGRIAQFRRVVDAVKKETSDRR